SVPNNILNLEKPEDDELASLNLTALKNSQNQVYRKHPIPIAIHQSPSVYWGFRDIRIFCLIVFLI
ncbi:MAG: hypothetical protein ACOCPA_11895, partial [Segatella copri]